jgi:CofD-related protein of GAK system
MRVERARRLPQLGPKLLFFTGGTALRGLSRRLKLYTENSIHLVTPFDSGGSSSLLRQAFHMPAVGDLRSRLMALADETERGNPEVYRLFSHRFPPDVANAELVRELASMSRGDHPLVKDVAMPLGRLIRTHLRIFLEQMPAGFDLQRASVGNLILAGGYLNNERDLESVVFLFSRLVHARGVVALTAESNYHLSARLADGTIVVGQHRLTGRDAPAIESAVEDLSLVASLDDTTPVEAAIDERTRQLITRADLIAYPMGSFYSSVIANLLPRGVGRAIRDAACPKIYVPNTGTDPEQVGMTVGTAVEQLVRYVGQDAGGRIEPRTALDAVLLDESDAPYTIPLDLDRIGALGIDVIRLPLVAGENGKIDPEALARVLVSLGS